VPAFPASTNSGKSLRILVPAAGSSESMLLLTAGAIVFSAQMVAGYALLDEAVVYALLGLILLTSWTNLPDLRSAPASRLFRLHRSVFVLFVAYCFIQVIRGAVALGDIREIRFLMMFAALGVTAWLHFQDAIDPVRVARITVSATAVYLALYVGAGLLAEGLFGLSRFDAQGSYWSGTTVALFPAIVVMPALAALPRKERSDRWLFWCTFLLITFAAFYYQSRLGWLVLACFLLLGASHLGWRRFAIASCVVGLFVLYFPWDKTGPLIPGTLAAEMWDNFTHTSPQLLEAKTERMVGTVPVRVESARDQDIDRLLALKAVWCHATEGTVLRFLFGTGYWTHRYELLECIHRVATAIDYEFPPSYRQAVRTATFNGSVVDTGFVGLILFAALFILTAWTIVQSRAGPRVISIGTLGMAGLSLFVSANYDVLLLYIVLMPAGPLLLLHARPAPVVR